MFGGDPSYEFTMKPITLGPNFTGAPDNTMNTSYSKF